jgi:hypothetical protein
MPRHLSQGGANTLDSMNVSHVINPRDANPDESEGDTCTSHWLKGPRAPKPPQNQKDTGNRRKDPQNSHLRKHKLRWAHKGSVDPIGRLNRPCGGSSGPSTWCFLVCPSLHPGGVCSHSTPVLRPINRRRGTSFFSNSLCNPSLTFGFQG